MGDAEETMETFWATVNWWRRYRALDIDIILLRAYPGSEIYKNACRDGIIKDPVQFLKDGCPPVNLSKMTDDEYYALPVLLDIIRVKNSLADALIEPLNDFTVNVTGICPHCGKRIGFPHYGFIFNHNPEACPVCGRPVVLNPIEHSDFDKLSKNLRPCLTGNGLAIWAVNANNFHWLLTSMPGLKSEKAVFINRQEIVIPHNGKVVKALGGKQIFQPDIISERGIDTVLVPNNPEAFNEIRALCGREYPSVKKIIHLSEWM
jgi:rRNA maturation protein Nop10